MAGNAFANNMGLPAEVILAIASQGGGGGGGEPSAYIKSASVSADGLTLTLTKKDGSKVTFSVSDINTAITALETEVDGKQDTISDLSTIRDNAGNGMLAYNQLNADVSYIELTAEDSETHDTTTFKIFGHEVNEGGGV